MSGIWPTSCPVRKKSTKYRNVNLKANRFTRLQEGAPLAPSTSLSEAACGSDSFVKAPIAAIPFEGGVLSGVLYVARTPLLSATPRFKSAGDGLILSRPPQRSMASGASHERADRVETGASNERPTSLPSQEGDARSPSPSF